MQDIPAVLDNGIYSAVLPIPPCGFGNDLSYKVDDQDRPNALNVVPCSNYKGAVKFTFLADAEEGTQYDAQFAKIMASFPGSGILNGGDFVETGTSLPDWRGYFKSMEAVGGSRVLFPCAGNHEYRYNTQAPMWKTFFKTAIHDEHYAFDMGAARVIF